MLDAYTSSPLAKEGMSDSDKFKEGYKKKGKGKVKNPPKKVEEAAEEAADDVEEVEESWDDGVVDSWDQIDVEEMPVPIKVKRQMRKEDKTRKKQEEKAAKAQPEEAEGGEAEAEDKAKKASPAPTDAVADKTEQVTEAVKKLDIKEPTPAPEPKAAAPGEKKELSEEEKAAVKADREAKKAAKAAKAAAAKQKKTEGATEPAGATENEAKSKEATSKPAASVTAVATDAAKEGEKTGPTKAERRAKQEAQRLAKAEAAGKAEPKKESKIRVPDEMKADDKKTEKKLAKTLTSQKVPARTPAQRQIPLFSHLHQYEREPSITCELPVAGGSLHPAVVQLGLQYSKGEVTGSSERCTSLLTTLRTLLTDLLPSLTPGPDLYRDIDNLIKPNITFLKQSRPLSISMQNAIRYLKREIKGLEPGLTMEEVREKITEAIDDFINVNFVLHPKAISETANKKIGDNDVILTFSHSKLVERVLVDAALAGRRPRVVVAEARSNVLPAQGGARGLAARLAEVGLHTTYLLLPALELVLPEVTLVLLGCEGVMANGCVLATVGTSQAALLAKAHNKPVVVCCETYKFTSRVQTDSFVYNELSAPEDLAVTGAGAEAWRDLPALSLLNLVYDLTPAAMVDSIITEISQIPPTSVPVVLRLHHLEGEEA